MNKKTAMDFTFHMESSDTSKNVFETLLNVRSWRIGLYSETINGKTEKLDDEFTFSAGGGVHYSKQKLVELIPEKKIVWLVTDSNLSFLEKPDEWTGTKICFDISTKGKKSQITFTHEGLVPKFECYNGCAGAWTQYLVNLANKLEQGNRLEQKIDL